MAEHLYSVTLRLFVRQETGVDAELAAKDAAEDAMLAAGGTIEAFVVEGCRASGEAELAAMEQDWDEGDDDG